MSAPDVEHAGWCSYHSTDPDGAPICQHSVTFGDFTVDIEDSPAWPDDERFQIVPPDLEYCDVEGAQHLAAALVEAARLLEETS